MNELWNDPKVWLYIAGIVGQAAIAWWRVGAVEKKGEQQEQRLNNHGERIAKIEGRLNGHVKD